MPSERILAPWRLAYVTDAAKDSAQSCIFCAKPAEGDDDRNLIVHRGERAFVLMNLYPYTNGHVMVAPYEHLGALQQIDPAVTAEMMELVQRSMQALERRYSPHGYNVGVNQGRVAGAGVEHHIHMHVVPRWGGDHNFMDVLADTSVLPETVEQAYSGIKEAF